MSITKRMKTEDVQKIANLARLRLTDAEAAPLAGELTAILKYVETLDALKLDGIAPTAHAVPVDNVFRDDIARQNGAIETTLERSPDHDGPFFLVPKVIG